MNDATRKRALLGADSVNLGLGFLLEKRGCDQVGGWVGQNRVACCAKCVTIAYMIKSFKHKGLLKFFETGSAVGIQPAHKKKLRMRLVALDTAIDIADIDLPGFRLHSLKGQEKGLWAIDVNKNWRITFEFKDGNVFVVDYKDYH